MVTKPTPREQIRRKKTKPPAITEKAFQAQVIEAARLLGWKEYHTYDSRRCVAGFPDLVLVRDRVIFAELKRDKGQLSVDQYEWLEMLKKTGAEVYVWRPCEWTKIEGVLKARETE